MPRCSAIVVTYNSAASIRSCLEALVYQDCETIVVDNGSSDGTLQAIQEFASKHAVQLIRISRNLGFGAAVNHGASASSGDVFLVLNPDSIAEAGAVGSLIECLDSTGVSAAGGALLNSDGQAQRGFAFRRLPTLISLLFEVLLINQLWPNNSVNRRYRCLDADYSRQQEVQQPAGACLAITRKAFDALGGFDSRFFPVWFEDVDLCKRLIDAGHKIVYCPSARFHHSGAHSVSQLSFRQKQLYWYGNMLRYADKHFSSWQRIVLRLGIVKGMALRWLANLLGKRPPGATRQEAGPAYIHVARAALGIASHS